MFRIAASSFIVRMTPSERGLIIAYIDSRARIIAQRVIARSSPTNLSKADKKMNPDIIRINMGVRLAGASIFNHVAYFAGQVPKTSVDQGISEQTAEVLAVIDNLLEQVGSDKSRILSCQIFLKDIAEIGAMNAVWDKWVPAGKCPSRATVQAQLGDPRWRIEIVLSAALNSAR